MKGKVCLITGATSGIGRAAARELAGRGATVIVAGRDPARTQATVRALREDHPGCHIDYLLADLSAQAEVRALADAFQTRFDRLDVLVNNAGAAFLRRQLSADGIEKTFALNHLSYFLLTNLLLEVLQSSSPSRIINVSSGSHRNAQIHFDDLGLSRNYWVMRAYGQSKLANILFTHELARRLDGSGVTANAMHPGFVATNIGKNNGPFVGLIMRFLHLNARTPEKGAETIVYLATSREVRGVTGKYFIDKNAVRSSPASYDLDAARKLWEVSARLTGLTP